MVQVLVLDLAKHFFHCLVLMMVQRIDVNLGPCYKNLTLNHWFLPFKLDTLIGPILVCESISHPLMPRYHANLTPSLKPLVGFQNISKRHCPWRPWSYASLGSVAMFLSNIKQHTTPCELAIIVVFHIDSCFWK